MYDHYISLGVDCEVSFQIQRVLPKFESYLFSWAAIGKLNKLISALLNLDQICAGDLIPQISSKSMYECTNTAIRFHGRKHFRDMRLVDGSLDQNILNEQIAELKSRVAHLRDKFINKLQDDTRKCLILKSRPTENANIEESSITINKLLRNNFNANNYTLLVLQQVTPEAKPHKIDNIAFRYLKRTAPVSDTRDGHIASWDKVFSHFPLKRRYVSTLIEVNDGSR